MDTKNLKSGLHIAGITLLSCLLNSACSQLQIPASTSSYSAATTAAPASAKALYTNIDKTDVFLSPNGKSITFLKRSGNTANIWLANTLNPDAAKPLISTPGRSVFNYLWTVGGQSILYMSGPNRELNTSNSAGDDYILYRLDLLSGESFALTKKLDRRARYRISELKPNEVFISPSTRGERPRSMLNINILTGKTSESNANAGYAPVYADDQLQGRISTHWRSKLGYDVFRRGVNKPGNGTGNGQWIKTLQLDFSERLGFKIFGFSSNGKFAYLTHTQNRDLGALIALNLDNGTQREIAHENKAMIVEILQDNDSGQPIAYRSEQQLSQWHVLDPNYRQDFNILQNFGQRELRIENRSEDDTTWIVSYTSDAALRNYYIYNRGTQPQFIFSNSSSIPNLAPIYPVATISEDGYEITGYLTLPPDSDTKHNGIPEQPLPTVVWVHGGPWGRLSFQYDPWAQWLAARGYAALNVNFRGSTGFGKKFIEAHRAEWGSEMKNDVLAMVDWAIKSGISDPKKLAISGESYGGYATLNLITDAPDKFSCAVTTAAISDLPLFLDTLTALSDSFSRKLPNALSDMQKRHLAALDRERMLLGGDERTDAGRAFLASRSPIHKVQNIKTPLLMFHMTPDTVVIPRQTEQVVEALRDSDVPLTYLDYSDEGHIITKLENRVAFFAVLDAFLAPCLGGTPSTIKREEINRSSLTLRSGGEHILGLKQAFQNTANTTNRDAQ